MIDIKKLDKEEEFANRYRDSIVNRGGSEKDFEKILELNKARKSLIADAEGMRSEQNKVSKEIAQKKKAKEDASQLLESMQKLSGQVKEAMHKADEMDEELKNYLLSLPNLCHESTPVGSSEEDNVEIHKKGEPTKFNFEAKDHVTLGENLGILDFERSGKVTGARFSFLKGLGSRLERALIQFMMDLHVDEHGYTEMIPPFMVNSNSMLGTSQLPKFAEDSFRLEGFDYFMAPTAEVPVTNYFREEVLNESDLPINFCAYTPCFRSEAGSYGKDTRGLFRQHQFNKVELVKFAHPNDSYEQHEKLTENAERVLDLLELPFKRMALCTGDIGFGAAKCYDIEVWLPGQGKYREISSCSNFEDYQARRADIRFKAAGGKPQYVHTLNGSGLAVGRCLISILENYQQEDGSIKIPSVLRNYMGGNTEIR